MPGRDQKNPFFDFFSPKQPHHNNHPENNLKNSKFLSGGKQVEQTYHMLEVAVEQSIDGIAVADLEGIIRFCNKAWAKMHGYHIYEILGKHLSIFHTQEQQEKVVIPFNEQVRKKGAHQGEVGHVKKNGKVFSTWMTTTLLKDAKAKPIGFLGIARNITREKRLHDMVVASEKKYRILFENAITGIGISQGNRVITANKALLDIFGYDNEEEFTKVPLLYHVALESRDLIRERMRKRQKGEQVEPEFEYKIIRKDGTIREIEASSSEMNIDNQKYVQTTFRDITENKKIENSLLLSEAKYQDLYQNAPDMFISVDAKTAKIIQFNKALLQATGYSEEEVIGRSIFEMYHSDCTEEVKKVFQLFATKGEVHNKEFYIQKKDGTKIEVCLNSSAIRDEKGNILYSRSILHEITERKKVERRITKINKCFLNFVHDPNKNINSLVSLCGEMMEAACALYSRLDKGLLYSIGQWQVPSDFNPVNEAEGLVCYDVIKKGRDDLFIIRNLDKSNFALTDPYVLKYGFKTYVGLPVKFAEEPIGALCVVYQKDFVPTEDDKKFMQIIASAIAVEEKRKQTKLSANRAEKEKEALLDTMYELVVYQDTNMRVLWANEAAGKSVGMNSEQLKGHYCYEIWHKRSQPCVACPVVRALETGQPQEGGITSPDGRVWLIRAYPMKDVNGQIIGIGEVALEITELKHTEEDLRISSNRYYTLFENSPISLWEEDFSEIKRYLKGLADSGFKDLRLYFEAHPDELLHCAGLAKIIDVNKTTLDLYKAKSKEDFKGNLITIFNSDSLLVFKEELIALAEGKTNFEGEAFTLTLTGEKIQIVLRLSVAPGYEDTWSKIFVSVVDITERKKAEEEILNISKFPSEDPNPVLRLDSKGNVIYKNEATTTLLKKLGFSDQGILNILPHNILATVEKTLRTNELLYGQESRIGDKIYSYTVVPIKDVGYVNLYCMDITALKLAEGKSERLNKKLFKSNRRLKQLVLRDSHTGLYNHRYLHDAMESEFSRAERYAQPLSAVMLDIDYFKSINDVYSHQFGDLVLKQFARQLKRIVRKYDTVIRFGGEEFVIISPGTDRHTTLMLTQRIINKINLCNFGDEKRNVKLKLSLAVVSYPEDKAAKGMDLIELADRILNKAKEDGGNRSYSSLEIGDKKAILEIGRERPDVKFLKGKIDRLHKRANQSLIESVFAFARTIKLKDHYTGEHVENTVQYATEIAKRLSLPREEIEHVRRAAMVHDLGKVGIRESILQKKSKLTRSEFSDIRKHPQIGADILRPIHFLGNIIPLIHYHHERWDGKGYPRGLKKEEIPLGARIVAIADVYQALISDRPYRKAYSKDRAINIIKAGSGSQFDPKIVDAFLKILQPK